MGMYRNRMPDREVSAEMTKADYWEVQADMWHQNYKEAAAHQHRELREATTDLLNAIDGLFPTDGPVKARVRAALKEKK